ncbi:MAG: hypothetical protein IJZ07_03305 [Clostridia bacterium]|nr:hypothetical protein [Clostridia bacterium]
MKNTVKKLLCTALAFIMAFAAIPAFATEIGNKVLWDEGYDEPGFYDEYRYGGKLTEGKNHLTPFLAEEDSYYYYYEFTAAKSGYYYVDGGVCYGEFGDDGILYYADLPIECSVETDDGCYDIVYFEEGTVIMGASFKDCERYYNELDVEIGYIDDEITDIIFDEKIVENLIINADITFFGDLFEIYDQDYIVVFSNGYEIEVESKSLYFTMKNEPVNGTNTVYATFAGYEKPTEATIYYIDYFVESVELSNVEYYLNAYEFYNGRYGFTDYNGEEITVNYTDGTSDTFVYGRYEDEGQTRYITINGKKYFLGISHSETNLILKVYIAGKTYAEYKCSPIKADVVSNRSYLMENLDWRWNRFVSDMESYVGKMLDIEYIDRWFTYFEMFLQNFTELGDMASEIIDYIKFFI